MSLPVATVVISTKDRRESLARTIESALAQTVAPEVLVIDDGSTDGTDEMVRARFPQVHLERSPVSRGYIAQRNLGASLARAKVVVSLDDDAYFPSDRTVEQTLVEFDHRRVGAVAIPFVNVNSGPQVLQRAPARGADIFVTDSFVGTAYAIRRDVFLGLGGFRTEFFHQGEERDLCLRMLATGRVVRLGTADPIHHVESPLRSWRRMALYGRRNDVLFAWYNVPTVMLPVHLSASSLLGLRCGLRTGHLGAMGLGLLRGAGAALRAPRARRPVSLRTYVLARRLRRGRGLPLGLFELTLPSLDRPEGV
ncbi:MAG: glycosyltransferase family 2 protein [Planctomycetes bacterium]|nr:glycosyltransferase family 2 protein [Planctomycetota bacterium]